TFRSSWGRPANRSDRGEFLRYYAAELCQRGIRCETTVKHAPQQNGVAESMSRMIEDRARAIVITSRPSSKLWDEVWRTTVRLYNRSPHLYLDGGLPHLAFFKRGVITLDYLHVIGSIAYAGLRPGFQTLVGDRGHKNPPGFPSRGRTEFRSRGTPDLALLSVLPKPRNTKLTKIRPGRVLFPVVGHAWELRQLIVSNGLHVRQFG
ncbi:MAG: hypothetical protein BJ554DRAFT_526, partial [Olpidium bornovanus]